MALGDKPLQKKDVTISLPGDASARLKISSSTPVGPVAAGFDGIDYRLPSPAGASNPVRIHFAESAVIAEAAQTLRPGGRLLIVDMTRHDRREYRDTMGHVHLGFEEQKIKAWANEADMQLVQFCRLRPCPEARGPGLFVAVLQLQ